MADVIYWHAIKLNKDHGSGVNWQDRNKPGQAD